MDQGGDCAGADLILIEGGRCPAGFPERVVQLRVCKLPTVERGPGDPRLVIGLAHVSTRRARRPIAVVARVARACEAAGKVGARRVGVAVVGPIYDRGARPVSSSVTPERGRAI